MKIPAGQIVSGTKLVFEIHGSITLKLNGRMYPTNMYSTMVCDNNEDVLAVSRNRPVPQVPDSIKNQTIAVFNEVEQSGD
jgi:hypothetical protein